jgi:Putative zinc-finger
MSEELKDAMQEIVRRGLDSHPDPERLAAYHAGELSPEEEGRVQDHLALCRECAALLLDLDGLADPDFGAGTDLTGKEAVWRSLQEEMAPPARVVPLRRTAPSSPRWLQALAASLLIATLGLSLWVASLHRTVTELSSPEPNAPVLDLYSSGTRGEGSPAPILTVSGDVRFFTLILNSAGQRRYEGYRVEIVRAGGGKVWENREIEPFSFGSFSLTIPRRMVGPGDYRVRLFGRNGGAEEPIDDYAFRVE